MSFGRVGRSILSRNAKKQARDNTGKFAKSGSGGGAKQLPPSLKKNLQARVNFLTKQKTTLGKELTEISRRQTQLKAKYTKRLSELKGAKTTVNRVNKARKVRDALNGLKKLEAKRKSAAKKLRQADAIMREISRLL